ncbi:IclR family transcriptional regulator [Gordonibacter sp. 28C]|uniref:IclR family transcriptional regulator n=1 Tax=Gordonibacter sp. 28C TaxID=2078569 RepID=UPI00131409A9|nr:IclR family transcriptional regulator [Gordonibacter sp. 28C]
MGEGSVQVLDRAFDILEALAQAQGPMGLSDLAQTTGMSKTTVFRIAGTMLKRGYVEKTLEGRYTIGPKMFHTLGYHINSLELQTEAKPYLTALKRSLGLTAHLGILDGAYVSYIEKEASDWGEEAYTQVGYRSPAYCSSMGKCLLACLSRAELEEALYGFEFKAHTPNTFTRKDEFVKYLHQVRAQGWAMDDEEYEIGHRCVAAPVFNYRGDAIAAVGVSGTPDSISDDRIDDISRQVMLAASRLSERMGYVE